MTQQENRKDDIKTESLADLELTNEQADETKAGGFSPYGGFRGGVYVAAGDVVG